MSHKRRARPSMPDHVRYVTPACSSGKRGFASKSEAKQAARRMRKQGDERLMNAYRCTSCGMVHIGHLPRVVRDGEITRGEYFAAHPEQEDAA